MPIISPNELLIDAYHSSAPDWLSKTSLRDYQQHGPEWWRQAYIAGTLKRPQPGGAAQGAYLDCWLTEGEEMFWRRHVVAPDGLDRRTKEGKAWAENNGGKTIVSGDDYLILRDAIAAVNSHPMWPRIAACQAQMTVRRHTASLGLGLQSRPDWLSADRRTLFDLKKTRDLDIFGRQAIDLGYHLQAAIAGWCLAGDGHALDDAYLVAVEWERGARCRVYRIPDQALEAGYKAMRASAGELAHRIKTGDWADYPPESEPLAIPAWMVAKMESSP